MTDAWFQRARPADHTSRANAASPRLAPWVACFAVLAFHAPLLSGAVPSGFDVVNEKLFWRQWTFDRLRHGELPLWNPHVLCGYPMHSDPVQALFYPLEWIHLILPHPLAIGISFTVAGLVACAGTTRLTRALGGSAWGAALAGVAYSISGLVAGHIALGEVPHLQSMAWTPWCLTLALEGMRGRRRSFCTLAAVVALAILAGHVQYAYQTLVGLAIFAVTASQLETERRAAVRRLMLWLPVAVALGVALAGVTLIPALSYVSHSNRGGGFDWTTSTTGAIHPLELLRALIPDFFGDAVTTTYWGGFIKEMSTPYVGLATLVALPWAFGARHRRAAFSVAPMALFGLLVALSAYTPIHRGVFRVLPGFAFFRMPVRWLHLTALGLAVLGGLGSSAVGAAAPGGARGWLDALRAALVPLTLTIVMMVVFIGPGCTGSSTPTYDRFEVALRSRVDSFLGAEPEAREPGWESDRPHRRAVACAASLQAILLSSVPALAYFLATRRAEAQRIIGPIGLLLAAFDLTLAGHRYVTTVPADSLHTPARLQAILDTDPTARTLTLLPGTITPRPLAFERSYPDFNRFSQASMHRAMVERRRDVGGVFFVVPADYRTLAGIESSFEHETIRDRPILDLLGVRWILAPTGTWPEGAPPAVGLILRGEDSGIRLLENPFAGPRAFLAERVEISPDAARARARLLEPGFARAGVVLLQTDLAGLPPGATSFADRGVAHGSVVVTVDRDERLEIQVESPRDALMLVNDAYDRGWVASIDGRRVPLVPADLALRGVPVPRGSHTVVLRYRPPSLFYGLAISILALVGWGGWRWATRRPQTEPC